ncbi:MAG: class I SAM-dependent methyltransferase [Bacteroidales bacterium]|nr:class I SAM-dependent methyltransferase [Bacteroidales bacterium]
MNEKCPWCESQKTQNYLWVKDEFLSKEDFLINECHNCGLLFTLPRPSKEKIGEYYKSNEYYSHQENKNGLIPKLYELIKRINLKRKWKMAANNMHSGKILDIGCGVGDFLHIMEEKGWETTGIEPSEDAKKIAKKRMKANILAPEEIEKLEDESQDLITMWHVLEHVDDLKSEVYHLHRLLKKGGRLVLALPNFQSFDAQYYKQFWAAYDVPRHLNHFCKNSITKIFSNSTLKLTKTDKLIWDAFYISYMSELYQHHNMALIRGAIRGLQSNLKATKSGEWSSLVYIFQKE